MYPKDLVYFQCMSTAEKILKSRPSNECRFSCFPRLFEVTPALVNKDVINDFWQRHCLKEPRLQEKQNQFWSILFRVRLRNTQIHFKAFTKHTDSPFASSPPPCRHTAIHNLCNYFPPIWKRACGMGGQPRAAEWQQWLWDCSAHAEQCLNLLCEDPESPLK